MKVIYTLEDSVLNKDYDLAVTSFGALRELILKGSGQNIQEFRTRYDSLAPNIQEEVLEDESVYIQETLEALEKEYKEKTLFNRMKRAVKEDDTRKLCLAFIERSRSLKITPQDTEYLTKISKELAEAKNLKEQLAIVGIENYRKVVDIKSEGFSTYNYTINLFEPYLGSSSKFEANQEIRIYLKYLSGLGSLESLYRKYSETNKEHSLKKSGNYENQQLESKFQNERVDLAELGLENYNFVVEETPDGKYILLDGFNRLFGSAHEPLLKDVLVKVYRNLDSKEYSRLVLNLNNWKIQKITHHSNIFEVLDRGMLYSLFAKFGVDTDLIRKEKDLYDNFLRGIIRRPHRNEEFVDALLKVETLVKLLDTRDFGKQFNDYVADIPSLHEEIHNEGFIEKFENWLFSEEMDKATETIKGYVYTSGVKTFLAKNGLLYQGE